MCIHTHTHTHTYIYICMYIYGSNHELLTAKFRLKLNKVGKNTRAFRYDLHQIPYDYTVEVTDSRD